MLVLAVACGGAGSSDTSFEVDASTEGAASAGEGSQDVATTESSSGDTGETGDGSCADPDDPALEPVGIYNDVTQDTVWTCDKVYLLESTIFVHATLDIEAGTTIRGLSGTGLAVAQDGRLNVNGTEDDPVVMTSNFDTPARGDWAGLFLFGDAPTNLGQPAIAKGFVDAEYYGGGDVAHNCGRLEYLRVEYAGFEVGDVEYNGITFYACGSDTVMSHVQVHMGQDDGIEWFGGGFDADHIIVTGAADDSLDIDQGFQGRLQYVFVHQDPLIGDNCFEISNQGDDFDAEPRTRPVIANATCVGSGPEGDKSKGMLLKEGTHGQFWNSVFTNSTNQGVLLTHPETQAQAEGGQIAFGGNVMAGNAIGFGTGSDASWTADELEAWVAAQPNNILDVAPTFASTDWGDPDITPAPGSNVIGNGLELPMGFEANDFSGAVDPDGENWTQAAWVNYAP